MVSLLFDERVKKIASNHLYRIDATIDTELLIEALDSFKERYGTFPPDLTALVQRGILARLPQDLDGEDYDYDPETGEVKAPTIPWKR